MIRRLGQAFPWLEDRDRALTLGLLAIALVIGGCHAHHSAYVEAEVVPARIEAYPQTYYDGRVVYLVDDRWYTRDGGRWVYYSVEPEPLYRYRGRVHAAPPASTRAVRAREHRRSEPRRRYSAPPARRVHH